MHQRRSWQTNMPSKYIQYYGFHKWPVWCAEWFACPWTLKVHNCLCVDKRVKEMQEGAGSQQMAGYPSLSHPAACRVQPRLHLCFWYISWLMRYTSNVGRLWSTPVCCFYETFMKIDLTWEYSKSETFVSGGGEAFGSRWCPCPFGCRKGALCRWVVIGLPGPFRQCQIARDGCEM